jgi:putative acetyltransferase
VIPDRQISVDDPRRPDVRALLQRHLEFSLEQTPPEHSFALDSDGLLDPAITFFSVRSPGELLGIGAIKQLDPEHAEIKSMHTAGAARGRGVGRAMLAHLLGVARARGCRRVSLETGTMEAFAPARALYSSVGFVPCEPFGEYERTKDNYFMTLVLDAGLTGVVAGVATGVATGVLSVTRGMPWTLLSIFVKRFFSAKTSCTYTMNYLRQEISLHDHEVVFG